MDVRDHEEQDTYLVLALTPAGYVGVAASQDAHEVASIASDLARRSGLGAVWAAPGPNELEADEEEGLRVAANPYDAARLARLAFVATGLARPDGESRCNYDAARRLTYEEALAQVVQAFPLWEETFKRPSPSNVEIVDSEGEKPYRGGARRDYNWMLHKELKWPKKLVLDPTTGKMKEVPDRSVEPIGFGPPKAASWGPKQKGTQWVTPNNGLLRPNAKLEKEAAAGMRPARSVGLALVPEHSAFSGFTAGQAANAVAGGSSESMPLGGLAYTQWGVDRKLTQNNTLCAGASSQCRASCLIYTGQNATSVYATALKQATTNALLAFPDAFMRLLVEAIFRWMHPGRTWMKAFDAAGFARSKSESGAPLPRDPGWAEQAALAAARGTAKLYAPAAKGVPFRTMHLEAPKDQRGFTGWGRKSNPKVVADYDRLVRLNVLADIPWELFTPWLFQINSLRLAPNANGRNVPRPRAAFYDYTKVQGRDAPDNYDLSFSFSGINWKACANEFSTGKRVVMAFAPCTESFAEWDIKELYLGTEEEGAPKGATKPKWRLPKSFPSGHFAGVKIIDGDVTDFRPRDKANCIVGLRFKRSAGNWYAEKTGVFVVRARIKRDSDGLLYAVLPETPEMHGVDTVA